MDAPVATRSELLAVRARTQLAKRGVELLRGKRAHLLDALGQAAGAAMADGEALEREGAEAHAALALASALEGSEAVRSAALAVAASPIALEARTEVVVGVDVATIHHGTVGRRATERGYALSATPAHVDEVADRFERVVELVLTLAAQQMRLARLAAEVRKVTRRVNALDQAVVPALEGAARRIASVLEERERQDRFRLGRFARGRHAGGLG